MNNTAGIPDIVNVCILVNYVAVNLLINTGLMLSDINQKFAIANRFQHSNKGKKIGLAVTGNCFQSKEVCLSTICLQNQTYCDVKLHVLKDLLTNVIVGQNILSFIFILLTHRKATKALSNYSNLLLEMPKYCYPLEI